MNSSDLLARKPIATLIAEGEENRKILFPTLGPISITAMGVGAIIGVGIFVITGIAAAKHAGPAVAISFLLSGVACAFVALCYSELTAMVPVTGSTYSYAYATLGELVAWIIGWDLVLEYAMGAATVATGWSGYMVSLLKDFGIVLPPSLTASLGTVVTLPDGTNAEGLINAPAALIIAFLTILLILGTKESAKFNNVMVILKLLIIGIFIALGATAIHPSNWTPFIPENTGKFGDFGWSGVLTGASIVFFAYVGFDAVSTCAQEAKKPQRDIPIGLLGSLGLSTILYILVALTLTGLVPYPQLNVSDPIAKGIDVIGIPLLSTLIKFGVVFGLTTVILVLLYGQSRIFFAMAKDGLLPSVFARVSPKFGTPYQSQMLIGVFVALIAALTPIDELSQMTNIGTLFAFIIVCIAVMYLRKSEKDAARPFKTPMMPLVPILGILSCATLMYALPWVTWLRFIVWLALGLIVYFAYSMRHSRLRRPD